MITWEAQLLEARDGIFKRFMDDGHPVKVRVLGPTHELAKRRADWLLSSFEGAAALMKLRVENIVQVQVVGFDEEKRCRSLRGNQTTLLVIDDC